MKAVRLLLASLLLLLGACAGDPSGEEITQAIVAEARRQLKALDTETLTLEGYTVLAHRTEAFGKRRRHSYQFEATVRYLKSTTDVAFIIVRPTVKGEVFVDQ